MINIARINRDAADIMADYVDQMLLEGRKNLQPYELSPLDLAILWQTTSARTREIEYHDANPEPEWLNDMREMEGWIEAGAPTP